MHPSATYLDHNRAYRRLDKSHALSNPVYYEATWHKFTALKAQTLEHLQEFSIFLSHPCSFEKKRKKTLSNSSPSKFSIIGKLSSLVRKYTDPIAPPDRPFLPGFSLQSSSSPCAGAARADPLAGMPGALLVQKSSLCVLSMRGAAAAERPIGD